DGGNVHLRRIEREVVAAILFRVVHGGIRIADEVDHVLSVFRTERDTDARREEDLLLIHVVRLADLGEHHAREIRSVRAFVLLSESFDEQAELIASEAADNGFARQYARETLDRKSTRLNSSHVKISYAVFCLKKKR